MTELNKLADLFERQTMEDVFGEPSWKEEGQKLAHMAGKFLYRANKVSDARKGEKLKDVGKLLLMASDILKRL